MTSFLPERRALVVALASTLLVIVAHRAPAQTVYACVWGHPDSVVGSSTLGSGLFRSRDLGRSWTHLGPRNLKTFSMEAVDADRGRTLYIGAGNGVHRSVDSGRTWRIVTDWRVAEALDVAVDQRDPRNVFAATAFGFWRSTDGGETWENPEGSLQSVYVFQLHAVDGALRAQTREPWVTEGASGFWESADAGATWSILGEVEPHVPERLGTLPVRQRYTVPGGDTLAATWGDGVHRSANGTWSPSGLNGSQVWRLVVTTY